MVEERPTWYQTFMEMAYVLSKRSHDSQTKNGAIIVNQNNRILGAGYNGFMRGIDDSKLPTTRPDKYPWMIHAEVNAILNCEHNPENATIYVTGHPCENCYQYIWQCGIKTIVYDINHNAKMLNWNMIKEIDKLLIGKITKIPLDYE